MHATAIVSRPSFDNIQDNLLVSGKLNYLVYILSISHYSIKSRFFLFNRNNTFMDSQCKERWSNFVLERCCHSNDTLLHIEGWSRFVFRNWVTLYLQWCHSRSYFNYLTSYKMGYIYWQINMKWLTYKVWGYRRAGGTGFVTFELFNH